MTSCSSKLYGGQRKNKQQQRRQVSQRKRVGGEEPNVEKPKVEEAAPVPEIVKKTKEVVESVAVSEPNTSVPESAPVPDSALESVPDSAPAPVPASAPASVPESAPAQVEEKKSMFGLGFFGLGGKRRTQRKQRKQRRTQKAGSQKTVIGRLYSKTCVHCLAMDNAWKNLEKMIKQRGGNIVIHSVEAAKLDQQLPKLNQIYLGGSDQRVELQGGYPTLFKIKNNKVEYYGGERTAEAMYNWASRQ